MLNRIQSMAVSVPFQIDLFPVVTGPFIKFIFLTLAANIVYTLLFHHICGPFFTLIKTMYKRVHKYEQKIMFIQG